MSLTTSILWVIDQYSSCKFRLCTVLFCYDDDNDNVNDNDNENDNGNGNGNGMPEEESTENWKVQPARKKLKVYGSRKRETFFPETATLTVVSKQNTCTTTPKTSPLEALTTKSCFPFCTIFDTLNSTTSTHKQTTSVPENTVDSNPVVIQSDQADGMILKKRRRSVKTKKEGATEFDFVEKVAATKQPTSTTCISAAKAFFDHLDSTKLQFDASNTRPQVHSKKCGRSTKTVNLQDDDLQQEYQAYSSASQESGVAPIALLEYANNRSEIFRRNEMFDGFLDG